VASEQIACSFCSRLRNEVRKLISGPTVYICDECVQLCSEIVEDEKVAEAAMDYPSPAELYQELDRYVVGQKQAKRVLSVAVYNHFKRIHYRPKQGEVELQKGNILLVGPTGCGKTLMAQTLAKRLDVPFALTDATALTEAGYVGEDVESIVKTLLHRAGGDPELAGRGIICIDEIDKLTGRGAGPSQGRDVSGEGVQQALLKLLEGRTCNISSETGRRREPRESVQIDTSQVLFICCGSFAGIEDVIDQRVGTKNLGFGARVESNQSTSDDLRQQIQHEDLINFGMIPEFMGRLPVVVPCQDLDVDSLTEILWRPKNALVKQYQHLLAIDNIDLRVTDGAMKAISEIALRRKAGARGLRAVMESLMLDVMYELPSRSDIRQCVIDKYAVENGLRPKLIAERKAS
jgi:ATP-dependent Clp protease ATP-binding subunit ClpX